MMVQSSIDPMCIMSERRNEVKKILGIEPGSMKSTRSIVGGLMDNR